MKKLRFYIAGHFFNRGGYLAIEELANGLKLIFGNEIEFYVPHRNDSINDKAGNDDIIDGISIYEADAQEVLKCDGVIACLDGVEIDAGVGGEVFGMAVLNEKRNDMINSLLKNTDLSYDKVLDLVGREKVIIGYTTDMRINKADDKFVKSIFKAKSMDDAINKIEQHKHNHLYRNLMITGACERYGALVSGYANNTNHIIEIANVIKELTFKDSLVHDFNAQLDRLGAIVKNQKEVLDVE